MSPGDDVTDPTVEQDCAGAVDALLARHDWQLLDRQTFIDQSAEYLRAGVATSPTRAAMHTYSHALYRACSGQEGRRRQERGYRELFRYLYDAAYWRYRDVCDDATQRALERMYRNVQSCRNAGAFLAFALQYLRDAARAIRRRRDEPTVSLETPIGSGEDVLALLVADPNQSEPFAGLVAQDRRNRLNQMIDDFLDKHPRAGQQLAALLLKYIAGLDDATISRRLDTSIDNVYVLRSRAKKKLEHDAAWQAWAGEFGISLEDTS